MEAQLQVPKELVTIGFRYKNEYAWQKINLEEVFSFCKSKSVAIVGGEAWIIKSITDHNEGEPTEFIQNLNSDNRLSLMARNENYLIYSIFPLQNGQVAVFSWSNDQQSLGISWTEYVKRTIEETRATINKGNLEEDILPEYKSRVYYNLQFILEDGTYI